MTDYTPTPDEEYDHYARPENQQAQGTPRRRSTRLTAQIPVRFPPLLAQARLRRGRYAGRRPTPRTDVVQPSPASDQALDLRVVAHQATFPGDLRDNRHSLSSTAVRYSEPNARTERLT